MLGGSLGSRLESCTHRALWRSCPCPWWLQDDPCHTPRTTRGPVLQRSIINEQLFCQRFSNHYYFIPISHHQVKRYSSFNFFTHSCRICHRCRGWSPSGSGRFGSCGCCSADICQSSPQLFRTDPEHTRDYALSEETSAQQLCNDLLWKTHLPGSNCYLWTFIKVSLRTLRLTSLMVHVQRSSPI